MTCRTHLNLYSHTLYTASSERALGLPALGGTTVPCSLSSPPAPQLFPPQQRGPTDELPPGGRRLCPIHSLRDRLWVKGRRAELGPVGGGGAGMFQKGVETTQRRLWLSTRSPCSGHLLHAFSLEPSSTPPRRCLRVLTPLTPFCTDNQTLEYQGPWRLVQPLLVLQVRKLRPGDRKGLCKITQGVPTEVGLTPGAADFQTCFFSFSRLTVDLPFPFSFSFFLLLFFFSLKNPKEEESWGARTGTNRR